MRVDCDAFDDAVFFYRYISTFFVLSDVKLQPMLHIAQALRFMTGFHPSDG